MNISGDIVSGSPHAEDLRLPGPKGLVMPQLSGFYGRGFPLSYVVLRIAFGLTMFTHGLPKILGTSHGSMADPMAGSTNLIANVIGLPFAPQLAVLVGILECFGGLALAAGLLTRIIAAMLAVQMLFICYALGPTYPWIDRGIEYPLMLGFTALLIAMGGSGPLSIDKAIGRQV